MKILMVMPSLDFLGGAAVVFIKLANYLEDNHNVTVLAYSICDEVLVQLKVTKIIVAKKNKKNKLYRYYFILKNSYLLRKSFDVINIHNYPSSLSLIFFKIPSIWMCNEPASVELRYKNKSGIKRMVVKFLLLVDKFLLSTNKNTIIVADSFNEKRVIREYNKESTIIPYGIDTNFFKYKKNNNRNFIILQVGVLTPEKNQLQTLQTLYEVNKIIKGVTLIFAGKPESKYLTLLCKKIIELNLEKQVIFLPNQTPEEIRELYYRSSVLMHPVKSQGGWLSAFEAISCGLPIITSNDFTAKKLIIANNLGVVTEDYAAAIKNIFLNKINDDEIYRRSVWVSNNLSWKKFCGKFLQAINEIYDRKP